MCIGTKLKFSEEAIATAQVFYHTFYSVMDQGDYETTVSPPSALGLFAADCCRDFGMNKHHYHNDVASGQWCQVGHYK